MQAVLFVLLRTAVSATQKDVDALLVSAEEELSHAIGAPCEFVRLRTYNAYTCALAVRTERLPPISLTWSEILRKFQLVYCLEPTDAPFGLFTSDADATPLVFLTFGRLNPALTWDSASDRLSANSDPAKLWLLRSLGWPDVVFGAGGTDPGALDKMLPEGVCNARAGAETAEGIGVPLFSRCFTITARRYHLGPVFDGGVDLSRVTGSLPGAIASFCIEPGAAPKVRKAIVAAVPPVWRPLSFKGYEDIVAVAVGDDPIPARDLISSYENAMMPMASKALLSARLLLLGDMNLTDDQPDDAEFDGVGTDTTMAPVPLPQEFMDAIKAVSAEASEVSATLHSMYWACNRFLGNRVHCMFVADVAKHLTWLTTYLDRLGPQLLAESGAANSSGGLARSACDFIRTESRYIGAALAQRAHGDYYDLFSDAPNVLHEYPAGIQRLFLAWSHLASTTIRATVGQDAGAFAIVDQGQAPVALSMWKQSVLIFPTGLVYGATNMAWPFCHEVGEAVFAAYFAPGFEETLAPAGQGAPRPGADGSGYWRLREHLRTSGIELSDAKGDLWLFKTCALMREVFCDFFAVQGPLLCDHRPALRHLARRVLAMDPTDADIVSPAFRALVLGMSVIESLPDPIADVRGLDREQRRDKVRAQCVKCARELTATDPLPRILKPGSNEAFDEEVLNMVAAARVLLKSLVDEADQGKLEQNLDAAVGLVGELGLLDETIVAAAKMMAELSRCQAFRLLAAGGSASGNENLLDALGTLNVWAQGALANSDVSVEVCSELLHLSDQAGAGPA